jgi:ATP phosphoribosyltransferase regulatory subunit
VPIGRVVATRLQNLSKPIRLYYAQPIYCNTPGLGGKSDEIMQSGIELIGSKGLRADLEVIVTAIEALGKCVPDFRIELGHAGFFKAIAAQLPVGEDVIEDIRLSIEAKNYPLLDTILDKLEPSHAVDAMRNLPRLFGGKEVFEEAAAYCMDEQSTATLSYLKELFDDLCQLNLGDKIMVDLGLVQRNDYYTDIVFSAYVPDFGDAVLTGGRYDNLLASFDAPMPAIGFAINVDAVTQVLIAHGRGPTAPSVEILVHGDPGFEIKALRHMSDMVAFGNCCENSVVETREAAIAYAKQNRIPRVDFVNETIETKQFR